jgi:thioredoxin reductase (NADPH)
MFLTKFLPMVCLTAASIGHPQENSVAPTVIIGGGVGGGTAAIYLARAGFKPVVIQGANPGGAIVQSEMVENWPGAMQIRGAELMERIRKQAETNGALFRNEEVVSVDFSKRPFTITTRSMEKPDELKTMRAASCIIATGSTPNFLHVPGEKEYWGKGVSNCAICDGSLYAGKRVGIVGGGDAAILEALYLSNIAKEVTIFVRKDRFKAIDEKRKEALLALPNVKILYQTSVEEVKGNGQYLTGVRIRQGDVASEMAIDGLFLAIGSQPSTALFKDKIDLDDKGYIVVKKGQQTSVPGVYAIGDVVDPFYKQAISAAGDGAKAALAIQTELSAAAPVLLATTKSIQTPKVEVQIVEILSRAQFEEELRTSTMPLVVDFYATWCSPCKRIAPRLESTAALLAGKVKFLKVNVDKCSDLTSNYNIRAMPTVLFFNQEGTIVDRKVGEREIGELLVQLSKG